MNGSHHLYIYSVTVHNGHEILKSGAAAERPTWRVKVRTLDAHDPHYQPGTVREAWASFPTLKAAKAYIDTGHPESIARRLVESALR